MKLVVTVADTILVRAVLAVMYTQMSTVPAFMESFIITEDVLLMGTSVMNV